MLKAGNWAARGISESWERHREGGEERQNALTNTIQGELFQKRGEMIDPEQDVDGHTQDRLEEVSVYDGCS
jgi:hypothetical protein